MKFRTDINGLRAIAVIAVVLFHFNPVWIQGGFAGVDVFFVISGYLMTGIIFRGIESNNFSLKNFYIARANRIIPALAVLCFTLFIFGWFFINMLDYVTLTKHIAGSMTFLSNILYWKEAGYFDSSSNTKWLLHTWSLSTEWQFYVIYPLILVAISKVISIASLKKLIVFFSILSFVFSVFITYKWATPAYYLLPTRAWEMMVGGVAYLYPLTIKKNHKTILEWLGILMIVSSYFLINKSTPWPGYLAILPVMGAFFIIQACRNESFVTGNIAFQKLGSWSYSIYLWHWPFAVSIHYFELSFYFIYLGIALSILFGFFSHKYIERFNFRKDFTNSFSYMKSIPLGMALCISLLGYISFSVIEHKFDNIPNVEKYNVAQGKYGHCFTGAIGSLNKDTSCIIGTSKSKPNVLLFGDSFTGHYEPLLQKVADDLDISIMSLTSASCFPTFSNSDHGAIGNIYINQCVKNRVYVKNNIDEFSTIIMSVRWDSFLPSNKGYSEEVYALVYSLLLQNKNIIFLPVPTIFKEKIGDRYKESLISNKQFRIQDYQVENISNTYNEERLNELNLRFSSFKNFVYIPKDSFFPEDSFQQEGQNIPYSADGAHISILGAEAIWNTIIANGVYNRIKPRLIQQTHSTPKREFVL